MRNPHTLLSPFLILDAAPSLVRQIATPWLGVLWLLSLPLRFLQVHYFRELGQMGSAAEQYGDLLLKLAFWVMAGFLLSLYGRAVFARACTLGLQSGRRVGTEAFRVPPAALLSYFYMALVCELLFFLFAWTYVTIPFFILLSGLAAVTALKVKQPGLLAPWKQLFSCVKFPGVYFTLLWVFAIGLLVAAINLYFASQVMIWFAGGFMGWDMSLWEYLVRPMPRFQLWPQEPLLGWLLTAGAVLAIEPFWLAALSVFVHRSGLHETGEDLRLWYQEIQGQSSS